MNVNSLNKCDSFNILLCSSALKIHFNPGDINRQIFL